MNASVPDRLFADRRLAAVYDPLDPDRSDLDAYAALATELGARTVLDLGCGTGTFAVLLAAQGLDVTGVDPAAASIDVARAKPGADRVRWVVGEIDAVADLRFDLVTMTGNVAQVFVSDEAWGAMLATAHDVVRAGGRVSHARAADARARQGMVRAGGLDQPVGPRRVRPGGDAQGNLVTESSGRARNRRGLRIGQLLRERDLSPKR